MMESRAEIPNQPFEALPPRKKMWKKERPHRLDAIARKKYVLP